MFTWPLDNPIVTRGFAYKSSIYVGGQHAAVDIVRPADTLGSPVNAVAAGLVVAVAFDSLSGNVISVDHDGGWRSHYRHLKEAPVLTEGDAITQGQTLGYVGSTGLSTGPHLHFDLWNKVKQDATAFYKNGWWAHDPQLYLGKEEEMTQDEFNKMFLKAVETVNFPARDEAGKTTTAAHTAAEFAETAHRAILHTADAAKHAGGKHTHPLSATISGQTEEN